MNEWVVDVYCDGASRRNGSPLASAGYGVYFLNSQLMKYNASVSLEDVWGFSTKFTNQYAELFAILHSLGAIYDIYRKSPSYRFCSFIINTDSQYSIDCLTKWWRGWKENGWRKTNGEPLAHGPIIRSAVDIALKIPVKYRYVPAHSGDFGNDRADLLANLACERMENDQRFQSRPSEF